MDNTDQSQQAVEWAVKHMLRKGDVLHLLHVVPQQHPVGMRNRL